MGFKTFTCVICGKEGLTKPTSYSVGEGERACREHQEAKAQAAARKKKDQENLSSRSDRRKIDFNNMRNSWKSIFGGVVIKKTTLDPRNEINLLLNVKRIVERYQLDKSIGVVESIGNIVNDAEITEVIPNFMNAVMPFFDFAIAARENNGLFTNGQALEMANKVYSNVLEMLDIIKRADEVSYPRFEDYEKKTLMLMQFTYNSVLSDFCEDMKKAVSLPESDPEYEICEGHFSEIINQARGVFESTIANYKNSRHFINPEYQPSDKLVEVLTVYTRFLSIFFEGYAALRPNPEYGMIDLAKDMNREIVEHFHKEFSTRGN